MTTRVVVAAAAITAVYAAGHLGTFDYIEYNTSRALVAITNLATRPLSQSRALIVRTPLVGAPGDPINVPYTSFIPGYLFLPWLLSRAVAPYTAARIVSLVGLAVIAAVIIRVARAGEPQAWGPALAGPSLREGGSLDPPGVVASGPSTVRPEPFDAVRPEPVEGRTLGAGFSRTTGAGILAAIAVLISPHAYDECLYLTDHPIAAAPWLIVVVGLESLGFARRRPVPLALAYAALAIVDHTFLLVALVPSALDAVGGGSVTGVTDVGSGQPSAVAQTFRAASDVGSGFSRTSGVASGFSRTWGLRISEFVQALVRRLWLAGVVEVGYLIWLDLTAPGSAGPTLRRAFLFRTGVEGSARGMLDGVKNLAQSTGGLDAERSATARMVGKAYLLVFAAQFLLALWLLPVLLKRAAVRPTRVDSRLTTRDGRLSTTERFFVILFGFYAVYFALFRQNTLEHPYLYSIYLVIPLAISTFVLHPSLAHRRDSLSPGTRERAGVRRKRDLLINGVGALTLIVSLVHSPWRLSDHMRLLDPAYPDQAAVRTIARYLTDHFARPDGVILMLDSDEAGAFIAEHLFVNAAALAYVQRPDVRIKVLTTDALEQAGVASGFGRTRPAPGPVSVEAYAVVLKGGDLSVPVRNRGVFHFAFRRVQDLRR